LRIIELLKKDNTLQSTQYLAFCTLGFFTGLRIGDILKLRYCDIKPTIKVQEEKTKKKRDITISQDVIDLINQCKDDLVKSDDDFVVPIGSHQCSMVLKKLVGRINVRGVNVSNHTMRKTFARSLWENTGENDAALILLSEILGHSSTAITRIYLGITDDEISKAYKTLSLKPIKKLK
jgi:integrase